MGEYFLTEADIFLAVVARDVLYYKNRPKNLLRMLDSCHSVQIWDVRV